jgi:hypothetical protein
MRPTRDTFTSCLPNFTKDFAADAQLAGSLTGHYAFRRGQNRNTNTRENPGNILSLCVDSATGFTHTLKTANDWTALTTLTNIFNLDT